MKVGVISDTHGLVRPEAIAALANSELILHAGDIGKPEVLEELKTIAPVIAVRGNNDKGAWANAIPERETITIEGLSVYLLHIATELDFNPITTGVQIVISGHSHKPSIQKLNGVLFLNPGSAGPRRFKLPVTIAQLQITGTLAEAEIVPLDV
ncbi:metallophosphoesterase family protein [Leptolyngbya sp. FACHB-711]|uniref:metallophosphoesterase family protein n=1 Tax=Leptolyngbya sp. FACHB-711 TaxID=2692813 RepID=UPI001683343D|nr:metallophosphoesterase family protein [Leptolyngbya sp. FACHB-711]MBD2026721.1 metallophosphoesterase family protein [Leptolyngbya sp. FACHB-711]